MSDLKGNWDNMKSFVPILVAALIALPILAEQKKPTLTPAPSAQKLRPDVTHGAPPGDGNAKTPTPFAERGKPTKDQREVALGGPDTAARGKPTKDQRQVTGKVISQSGSTFTVIANGKELTFSAARLKSLPKVGDVLDITYTQTPGGPMEATTVSTTLSRPPK